MLRKFACDIQANSACSRGLAEKATLDADRTYSSAQVCRAAGLPRPTFDTWLLRRFLPLPPGPGTGRERQYSLLDAVRIAVAAELTRQGIAIGIAGRRCALIQQPFAEPRTALLLVGSFPTGDSAPAERGPASAVWRFGSFEDIAHALRYRFLNGPPAAFTMVDVTAVAERTRALLEDPDNVPAPTSWLDEDPERTTFA
jgi:hypothetical protein